MSANVVSVIMACYNQAQYLTEAVESVIGQTYPHWECIIVNDGSADDTEEVAATLMKKDSRIRYYRINNSGVCFVRNFGVEKCAGDFILPLDADDKIHPDYLEKAINIFKEKDVRLVYCEADFFDAKTGRFELPEFSLAGLAKMNMIFCSAVFKKQHFMAAGGYNPNMKLGWEDWDLWISMLQNSGEAYKINETLFYYRIKQQSRTSLLEDARKQKMAMQLYLNHPSFFDQYYTQPIEFFYEYRDLKEAHSRLKGLLTLQPRAYMQLAKKIFASQKKNTTQYS